MKCEGHSGRRILWTAYRPLRPFSVSARSPPLSILSLRGGEGVTSSEAALILRWGLLRAPVTPSPCVVKGVLLGVCKYDSIRKYRDGISDPSCDCSPILLKTSSSTRRGARELRFVKWALKAARRLLRGSWKNYTCCFGGVSLWLLLFYLPKWVVTEFGYI